MVTLDKTEHAIIRVVIITFVIMKIMIMIWVCGAQTYMASSSSSRRERPRGRARLRVRLRGRLYGRLHGCLLQALSWNEMNRDQGYAI